MKTILVLLLLYLFGCSSPSPNVIICKPIKGGYENTMHRDEGIVGVWTNSVDWVQTPNK